MLEFHFRLEEHEKIAVLRLQGMIRVAEQRLKLVQ